MKTGEALKPSETPGAHRTYVSIQYLRAIAALMVVAWHAQGQMGLAGARVLESGIELFFIISGFVMWEVADRSEGRPGRFVARRLIRVVPLYWALTSAVVLVAWVAPALLQSLRLAPAHVLASYLFLPWPNPTQGVGLKPLLIPGWTLNYEMAFYGLVAASLWVPRPWRGGVLIGVLTAAPLCGSLVAHAGGLLGFYTSPLTAEFALGIALAMAVRAAPRWTFRWGGPAVVVGGALLLVSGAVIDTEASWRLVLFALPVVLIVGGAALWERDARRGVCAPLKLLGDASYPLYIVHTVLLSALAQVWRRTLSGHAPPLVFLIVGLIVSALVGIALHFSVERPLARIFQSRPPRETDRNRRNANWPAAASAPTLKAP